MTENSPTANPVPDGFIGISGPDADETADPVKLAAVVENRASDALSVLEARKTLPLPH